MKRFFLYAFISILIHSLLFIRGYGKFSAKNQVTAPPKSITVSFTPQKTSSHAPQKPAIAEKSKKKVKKKRKKTKKQKKTQSQYPQNNNKNSRQNSAAKKQGTGLIKKAFPLYKKKLALKYPRLAKKRGYEGTVILEVLVNQNGKPADIRIFSTSGYPILDRAAVKSVKKWYFQPALQGNKKISMRVKIPVRFKLR